MDDIKDVEITTARTIRIGEYRFQEYQDNLGMFSFTRSWAVGESTYDSDWPNPVDARKAREMAAALNAFADAAEEES